MMTMTGMSRSDVLFEARTPRYPFRLLRFACDHADDDYMTNDHVDYDDDDELHDFTLTTFKFGSFSQLSCYCRFFDL